MQLCTNAQVRAYNPPPAGPTAQYDKSEPAGGYRRGRGQVGLYQLAAANSQFFSVIVVDACGDVGRGVESSKG